MRLSRSAFRAFRGGTVIYSYETGYNVLSREEIPPGQYQSPGSCARARVTQHVRRVPRLIVASSGSKLARRSTRRMGCGKTPKGGSGLLLSGKRAVPEVLGFFLHRSSSAERCSEPGI